MQDLTVHAPQPLGRRSSSGSSVESSSGGQHPPDSHRPLPVWTQPQTLPPADVKVPVTWPDESQESIGCRSNHRTALKLFQWVICHCDVYVFVSACECVCVCVCACTYPTTIMDSYPATSTLEVVTKECLQLSSSRLFLTVSGKKMHAPLKFPLVSLSPA